MDNRDARETEVRDDSGAQGDGQTGRVPDLQPPAPEEPPEPGTDPLHEGP